MRKPANRTRARLEARHAAIAHIVDAVESGELSPSDSAKLVALVDKLTRDAEGTR